MLLKDHPIRIDGEEIIWPEQWSEDSEVIENVNQTAAGTDQIEVTRYDKLSISCAFSCSPEWAMKFKRLSKKDSIKLTRYDVESGLDEERIMRIRDFSCELKEHSYRITPNGLWNVSFEMIEF